MKKIKIFTYSDIVGLISNPQKVTFKYNNIKYNVFSAKNDSTLLIHSFELGTPTKKLTSFIYQLNKELGIKESITPPAPAPKIEVKKIDTSIYTNKITSPIVPLSEPFLETLQLSKIFKEDYQKHRAIKIYDEKHEVIFFENSEKPNIRYKWNGKQKLKGWYTFEGLENVGGVFYGSNKKRSTLVLVEGLKDGLNANIALPQCDILISDSKNTQYDFSLINIDDYKSIILFQDRRTHEIPKELIKQFETLKGKERTFFKKTKYVDYRKLPANISDLTDFLESLDLTAKKLKRGALKAIKDVLHSTDTLKQIENDIEIDTHVNKRIEQAKTFKNDTLLKEMIKKKLLLNGDITEDIKYYVKSKITPPTTATNILLNSSKFLSDVSDEIIKLFDLHTKIILGSPTGTGKSYFTKESLTKKFKNMIIIAPLKKVASELSESKTTNITHIENNEKLDAVLANINAPYISLTTDTFYNLLENKKTSEVMKQRLSECELIVFDEQHIVEQSQNFRGKVVATANYLKDEYNGKVLMMSGTPIFSDLPNFHAVQAKLNDRFISTIDYYTDPFRDEKELMEAIKEELKNGNVLLYSKSRKNAQYINNFLKENKINSLLVTSRGNEYQGNAIEDNQIDNIDENIAIVSTTRATTGVNFKNLSVIFQFGSAYDTNTFIQLMARIRGNGRYYFIKLMGDKAQDESIKNKAIRILNMAKELQLKNISSLFQQNTKYIKKYIELPFESYNLKSFLLVYKNALQLIESENIGKLTEDREDFEFTDRLEEIEERTFNKIFDNGDSVEFTKYIEREMIDFLQRKSNVEILNNAYNLSFKIVHENIEINYDEIGSKQLLTSDDADEKQIKSDERKEKQDKFKTEILKKFDWFLNSRNQKLFFKAFGAGELSKLLEDNRLNEEQNQEKILKIKTTSAQLTALKFFTISRQSIIKKAYLEIKKNGFVTINDLSTVLEQEILLTTKTAKNPFSKFIKDFLENDEFSKNNLEIKNKIKVGGKQVKSAITLPSQITKELKQIKQKEEREKARLEHIEKQQKELIEKYEKKYNCEIVFEDETTPKTPTKEELERTIADDNISLDIRAKAMQQLANLEGVA